MAGIGWGCSLGGHATMYGCSRSPCTDCISTAVAETAVLKRMKFVNEICIVMTTSIFAQ